MPRSGGTQLSAPCWASALRLAHSRPEGKAGAEFSTTLPPFLASAKGARLPRILGRDGAHQLGLVRLHGLVLTAQPCGLVPSLASIHPGLVAVGLKIGGAAFDLRGANLGGAGPFRHGCELVPQFPDPLLRSGLCSGCEGTRVTIHGTPYAIGRDQMVVLVETPKPEPEPEPKKTS